MTRPYIRIINCNITGYYAGIVIGGGSDGYSDVRIENCDVYTNRRNRDAALWRGAYALSNVYIGNCRVYNNTGIASQSLSNRQRNQKYQSQWRDG